MGELGQRARQLSFEDDHLLRMMSRIPLTVPQDLLLEWSCGGQLKLYGIHNDESEIQVHVCPPIRRVYTFRSGVALDLVVTRRFRAKRAHINKILTGYGYLVPPRLIPGCQQTKLPEVWWQASGILEELGRHRQSQKGSKAELLVRWALREGMLAIPVQAERVRALQEQIRGVDLKTLPSDVQVKCDWPGGPLAYGGTGHLYLQVAEANPYGIY